MNSPTPGGSSSTTVVPSTAADIVAAIRATTLAPADRVEILRALRETMPDMVPPDPLQKGRIRVAKGVSQQFVDAAINGLTSSEVWAQSAATTSAEMQAHRDFEEQRPVFDELKTYIDILGYGLSYHHWQGIAKARRVYKVGKQLGGDEGLVLQPHIEIMASTLPRRSRKAKTPQPPAASTTPPKTVSE